MDGSISSSSGSFDFQVPINTRKEGSVSRPLSAGSVRTDFVVVFEVGFENLAQLPLNGKKRLDQTPNAVTEQQIDLLAPFDYSAGAVRSSVGV